MSDDDTDPEEGAEKKSGKMGLIIGAVLALVLGGGAFFAVYSGMILGASSETEVAEKVTEDKEPVAFVALDPLIVSLGKGSRKQLRFLAQLEVDPARSEEVAYLMPRILDILNGYLRAVDITELEDPASLIRLRAHMLRRVQLVTGDGYVNDLLITEFIFI